MTRQHRRLLRRLRALVKHRRVRPTLKRTRWGWRVEVGHSAWYCNGRNEVLRAALDDARRGVT